MNEMIKETGTEETGEKTFTQEQLNAIVSKRLAEDRERRSAELDEREKAIKAREMAVLAAEKLAAAGLPKDLTAVLRYDDEASLDAAINQLSTLRGFKKAEDKPDSGKKILVNKLPEASEFDDTDNRIRNAFRATIE